jgi:hypothetical protein
VNLLVGPAQRTDGPHWAGGAMPTLPTSPMFRGSFDNGPNRRAQERERAAARATERENAVPATGVRWGSGGRDLLSGVGTLKSAPSIHRRPRGANYTLVQTTVRRRTKWLGPKSRAGISLPVMGPNRRAQERERPAARAAAEAKRTDRGSSEDRCHLECSAGRRPGLVVLSDDRRRHRGRAAVGQHQPQSQQKKSEPDR